MSQRYPVSEHLALRYKILKNRLGKAERHEIQF